MQSSEYRSYGWTYIIAGFAILLGGAVMFFDTASSRLYLTTLIAGPIMLCRGIFLLCHDPAPTAAQKPPVPTSQPEGAQSETPAGSTEPNMSLETPTLYPQPRPAEPAWLRESFSAQPLPPVTILPTSTDAPAAANEKEKSPAQDFNQGLWAYVLPCTFFLGILVLIVYITPELISSWRIAEARGEAEAAYIKRRAELRADAEHAENMLELLDKRPQADSMGFVAVLRKVAPMVVSVSNLSRRQEPGAPPIPVYDPIQDKRFWQKSVGSGFVAKPGFILTNHHVVEGAEVLRVTFASGQSVFVNASAKSSDEVMDLAVIRIPDNDDVKTALEFADSDKVQVGSLTLTIGSPLGLKNTASHGIISAKGRLTNWLPVELLQTDAAINPGSSGGPLFDLHGRVIGVNVALASDNGRNQGIGFAIPSNAARKIFDRLVTEGKIPHGFLGISLPRDDQPPQVELGKQDVGGAVIERVQPNTPAGKSGLRDGDIVVRFNNEVLARNEPCKHLKQMISSIEPGTKVTLVVLRGGQRLEIEAVLARRPDNLP
jgi:S1-C subfamily serine protease